MLFDRESWGRFMAGYVIVDATIGFEDGRLGLLLYEETGTEAQMEDGFQIRLLAVKVGNPIATRFFSMSSNGLSVGARLSSAWAPKASEFVAVGIGLETYSYKPKSHKGREADIPFEVRKLRPDAYSEFGAGVLKTVRVGSTVYAIGGPFRVFERIGPQQWKEHADIPLPEQLGSRDREAALAAIGDSAFYDLGGSSEDDLYAVGSAGTIWRRKAAQWHQMPFPESIRLQTVAVAPDGTAYITDIRGSVWKGADDQWERIVQADNMLPYRDSVWFSGRLYCSNDSAGCFVLEDGQMVAAYRARRDAMPTSTAIHAHNLDVSPDQSKLLIAGMYGATLYDGQTWQLLFDGGPD